MLVLKDSRHPLLEIVDSNCIVNDIIMDQESSYLHVITGPNVYDIYIYVYIRWEANPRLSDR